MVQIENEPTRPLYFCSTVAFTRKKFPFILERNLHFDDGASLRPNGIRSHSPSSPTCEASFTSS